MRLNVLAPLVAGVCLFASAAAAEVRVTVANGLVSISAQDATTRQILAEWARVGQVRIVNLERVTGAPMTIELTNVTETQALDTLLRQMAGYMAAPRTVAVAGASRYDRLYLMTGGAGAPAAASAPVMPTPTRPGFVQAPVFLPPDQGVDDDEPQPVQAPVVAPPSVQPGGQRPTVFSTFPQQQPPADDEDDRPEPAATAPASPAGVARPGMVVPAPPQPGQDQNGRNRR